MTERRNKSARPHVPREIILQYADRHPRLRQWGQLLLIQGNQQQPDLARAFLSTVERFNAVVEASGNTFFNNLPGVGESLYSENDLLLIGLSDGGALGLQLDRCFEGMCVIGPSGSGKSTFAWHIIAQMVYHGFSVLFFDQKTEARNLKNHPVIGNQVTILQVEDIQFGLYQPIAGVRDEVIIANTTELLGKAMGKLSAQHLLPDIVRGIRERQVVQREEGIPLSVLEEGTRHQKTLSRRTNELKDSLLQGLSILGSRLRSVLDYRQTNFLDVIGSRPGLYIIESPGLPPALMTFCTSFACMTLFQSRAAVLRDQRLAMMIVLDDATMSVSQVNESRYAGHSPLTDYLLLMRERRVGLMIMGHTFGGMSELVRQNLGTYVFTGIRSENKHVLRDLIGLDDRQLEQMRVLSREQAVAFAPATWSRPLLGNVPFTPLAYVNDAMCRRSAACFLELVQFVRWTPGAPAEPMTGQNAQEEAYPLGPAERRYLIEANSQVPRTVTMLAQACGISRDTGQNVLRDIEHHGLVKTIVASTGRRGAPYRLVILTERGEQKVRSMGLDVAEQKLHGGRLHNGVGIAVAQVMRRQGHSVQFEVVVGNHRCDVRSQSHSSEIVMFQIGVSEVSREVDSVVGMFGEFPNASWKVVVVCLNKGFLERCNQMLRERLGSNFNRVKTVLMGRVLYAFYNNDSRF